MFPILYHNCLVGVILENNGHLLLILIYYSPHNTPGHLRLCTCSRNVEDIELYHHAAGVGDSER